MADAKICDRCGNFYQTHSVSDNAEGFTDKLILEEQDKMGRTSGVERYDICPNCRQELDNWLKGMKEKT
jgi:hypothetical protein